ncbi:MAG TPA: dienelactone hydrolase family protein [Bacteroidales bacterium]|nr:dienelactone hydrolase family protein [Bacteroidales bacterium]
MIARNAFLWIIAFVTISAFQQAKAQKTITFPSKDSLTITADYYEADPKAPFILLFHQAGSSRGEFTEIAPRFVKLGYNCLAVDLRSGNETKYVINQTALKAKSQKKPTKYLNAALDMQAAIEYASNKSRKPVVVLGSSYSASLGLLLAKTNPQISAVIAFSPGEYFEKENFTRDSIAGLDIPIFAASAKDEYKYLTALFGKVNRINYTLFCPSKGNGEHGAKALWTESPENGEYWLALMLFINQIKDF